MQYTGIKTNKNEAKRKRLIDFVFLMFMALAVFRLFAFFSFFEFPAILNSYFTLLLGAIMLIEMLLSIRDMSKGVSILWIALISSLAISYLTHFSGMEYICNTIIFLATLTVLPQIRWKREWTELLLLIFTVYIVCLALFVNRTYEEKDALIFHNPNTTAFIFVLYQFVLVAYARTLDRVRKILLYLAALITVYIQLQFNGRSSLIGTVLLIVYCMLQWFFDKFSRRRIKWLTIALCAGGIIFAYFYVYVLYALMGNDRFFLGKDLFTGREVIWQDAFAQIRRHWFFGIGNNLYSIPINDDYGPTNLHNQMMGYYVTFGLFAAVFYAVLLGVLVARLGNTKRKTAVAFVLILIVVSYFDTILYSNNVVYLPIALTIVYNFDNERERRKQMVIHYVWLGGNEKSKKIKYCMESWQKKCPDAKIIEWNESNYDVHKNPYIAEAYEQGKYAFVADYMRFDILYNQGGVYMDTDVELLKDIEPLTKESFMGFERDGEVAPGLIMNAFGGEALIKEILDYYDAQESFTTDKTVVDITTEILVKHGLKQDGTKQTVAGFIIYPTEYFNPKGGDYGKEKITENTYSIHHYEASWKSPLDQLIMRYKVKYGVKKGKILFTLRHPVKAIKKWRENV